MRKLAIVTLVATGLAFSGCETLENLCGINAEDLGFAEDYTKQLNAAIYIYQQSDRALRDSTLRANGSAELDGAMCTRTADSIIVNYGNGTACADGKIRRGSFRIGYSGDYMLSGSTANLVLNNYFEEDAAYTGGIALQNITSSSEPSINVDVLNIASADLRLAGAITAVWSSGFESQDNSLDDEYALSGGLDLTNTTSTDVFNGVINSPLLISAACEYTFVAGNISLTSTNADFPAVGIDFIPGDCSNLFTAQVDCEGNALTFSYPIK